MGRAMAQNMAQVKGLSVETLVDWHLQANFLPPCPLVWVPVCVEIVNTLRAVADGLLNTHAAIEWLDTRVEHITRPDTLIERGAIAEGLHLIDLVPEEAYVERE